MQSLCGPESPPYLVTVAVNIATVNERFSFRDWESSLSHLMTMNSLVDRGGVSVHIRYMA